MNGFDDASVAFDQRAADNFHQAAQIDDNRLGVLDHVVHVLLAACENKSRKWLQEGHGCEKTRYTTRS